MAGQVEQHPPPLAARLVRRLARAQLHQSAPGPVEVVDREVEVELLRRGGVQPTRGPVVGNALEPDDESVRARERGEVGVGRGVAG